MDLRDGLVRFDKQLTSPLACWDLAQASHAGSSELLKLWNSWEELEKSWRRAGEELEKSCSLEKEELEDLCRKSGWTSLRQELDVSQLFH